MVTPKRSACVVLSTTMLFLSFLSFSQSVVINEIMSDNESVIADEDGSFSDWIELYNTSDVPVSLENLYLSDDENAPLKWEIPNLTLPPHGFLLVFASGKNKDQGELHTNFKISSSGEIVILSDDVGNWIDHIPAVPLVANQSFGKIPDGMGYPVTLNRNSPLGSNNFNNALEFSHETGFYTAPFSQVITATFDDPVHYTTDGSEPKGSSEIWTGDQSFGYTYSKPNLISEIPSAPSMDLTNHLFWVPPNDEVEKAHVLRYATFRNGIRTSPIYSHTYWVDSLINTKFSMPLVSLVTTSKNFFDDESGIYVPGQAFDMTSPHHTGNYQNRGAEWERPIHISYLTTEGELVMEQDAGVRINGGYSRMAPQKSLRLYAREEYGDKYFDYNVFPGRELDSYKRLILRSPMGAKFNTLINDVLAHELVRDMDLDFMDYQPAVVFLNGEYWGIHTIRERVDEYYIAAHHDLDPEDVIIVNTWENEDYLALISYVSENDLSMDAHYQWVADRMDISNYIDYQIAEIFLNNYDWPLNNQKIWKPANGGKWRWIFFDIDQGFGDARYNMMEHSTLNDESVGWPNPPSSTLLFRRLLENEGFRTAFLDRFAEMLAGDFSVEKTFAKLDDVIALYEDEMERYIERWDYTESLEEWEEKVDFFIRLYLENRPCIMDTHIRDYFEQEYYGFSCGEDNENPNNWFVAPNPNPGNFYLYNNTTEDALVDYALYSMDGRLYGSDTNVPIIAEGQKDIRLEKLTSGTYFLHVQSNGMNEIHKIVIINNGY